MSKPNYLGQGIKPYQYYYFRCIIPKDLREILGKSVFIDYLITRLPKKWEWREKVWKFFVVSNRIQIVVTLLVILSPTKKNWQKLMRSQF